MPYNDYKAMEKQKQVVIKQKTKFIHEIEPELYKPRKEI